MACGSSIFDGVPPLNDAFPVFGINQRYKEDQNPDKVNLSIGGVYQTSLMFTNISFLV